MDTAVRLTALEQLRQILDAMPAGSLVPRDWLVARLNVPDGHPTRSHSAPPPNLVDLTVRDLALLFAKRPSTIRGWIERGDFPGSYKLHQKEWRVPRSAVVAFQEKQRTREPDSPADLSAWRARRPA